MPFLIPPCPGQCVVPRGRPVKAIGINGKRQEELEYGNLARKGLEGAGPKEARTELVHLYDLNYKGCISCFACKKKSGKSYGKMCSQGWFDASPEKSQGSRCDHPGIAESILERSPGEMRSFLERLFFPLFTYITDPRGVSFPHERSATAFIYTWGP